jgi:pimeloyl-ACP methyl ester carboxylesterase
MTTTTTLFLTDKGEGDAVVLLHSGGMSSRQWRLLGDVLSARWRVITPDLLGSGANRPFVDDPGFELQQDADAVLASLPAVGSFHLVGHSYGAILALKIAQQQRARVRSLALYEPPAWGVLREPEDHEALLELEALERSGLGDDVTGGTEPWLRGFVDFWNGPGSWERMPEPGRTAFLKVGRKVYREVRSIMADRTPASAYASVTVPALLLNGGVSPLPERRVMARLAAALPRVQAVTFEKAGHMGPLTHAADVNDAIAHHLAFAR